MAEQAKVSFDQLLATLSKQNGQELQDRKLKLEKKRADLQNKLAEVQRELKEIESQLTMPVREAVKASRILGIEVPLEYQQQLGNGNGNGHTCGKFYWEVKGMTPFQAEVSRAMWRLSGGSGGSAGKNGEGVLTAGEFWGLAGITPEKVELGNRYTVDLPNGKQVALQKLEA